MRYSASDKTEIIRLVEQSPWPARRTLEKLGIPRGELPADRSPIPSWRP
jgi:hypothetical protein